jgi:hypothetical protein
MEDGRRPPDDGLYGDDSCDEVRRYDAQQHRSGLIAGATIESLCQDGAGSPFRCIATRTFLALAEILISMAAIAQLASFVETV